MKRLTGYGETISRRLCRSYSIARTCADSRCQAAQAQADEGNEERRRGLHFKLG